MPRYSGQVVAAVLVSKMRKVQRAGAVVQRQEEGVAADEWQQTFTFITSWICHISVNKLALVVSETLEFQTTIRHLSGGTSADVFPGGWVIRHVKYSFN